MVVARLAARQLHRACLVPPPPDRALRNDRLRGMTRGGRYETALAAGNRAVRVEHHVFHILPCRSTISITRGYTRRRGSRQLIIRQSGRARTVQMGIRLSSTTRARRIRGGQSRTSLTPTRAWATPQNPRNPQPSMAPLIPSSPTACGARTRVPLVVVPPPPPSVPQARRRHRRDVRVASWFARTGRNPHVPGARSDKTGTIGASIEGRMAADGQRQACKRPTLGVHKA